VKSVEQKLYEAFRSARGLRLSADEVDALVRPDDAIGTRITNQACDEAGVPELGQDAVSRSAFIAPSWAQFLKLLRTTTKASQPEAREHE